MKKSILNLGKTLNKKEQKSINGGSNCDYYARINLCFADNCSFCFPCSQMSLYPGAATCYNLDNGCLE